jgi:large subunit ribosomal protein L15
MQLHTIQPYTERDTKKRVGRGGKRGTTSGRGQKGQNARAGHKKKPAMWETLIRTPKKRGYKNKPKAAPAEHLNLDSLKNVKEQKITKEVLLALGLISSASASVKILGRGEISSAHEFVGFEVSASAAEKIKKAGGSIVS